MLQMRRPGGRVQDLGDKPTSVATLWGIRLSGYERRPASRDQRANHEALTVRSCWSQSMATAFKSHRYRRRDFG
jgi:hypothetical protein